MIDDADLEEIYRFLGTVEQPDLFAYLSQERDASASKVKTALRRRRSWAQGQQANPKYRQEALWLIKNIQLVRTALIDQREVYLSETDERANQRNIQALRFFIQTTLVDGTLHPQDEAKILECAEELGIDEAEVTAHIELVLTAMDQGVLETTPQEEDEAPDHYEVLDVEPGVDQEALEAAYRERYRWARNLRDTEESSRVYAELDAAWRVLKDPERRAQYDLERGAAPAAPIFTDEGPAAKPRSDAPDSQATASEETQPSDTPAAARTDGDQIGYLPPPDLPPPPQVPPPPEVPLFTEPMVVEAEEDAEDAHFEMPEMDLEDPDDSMDGAQEPAFGEDAAPAEAIGPEDDLFAPAPSGQPSLYSSDEEADASDTTIDFSSPAEEPSTRSMQASTAPPEGPVLEIGEMDDEALPILKVEGPSTIRIRTGNNPFPVRIMVKNAGEGQMSGSISSTAEWVEISPRHLNPNRAEHSIEVLVDPDKMPGNSARTTVEISTGHGEKAEVIIDAIKHLISPVVAIGSAVALLLIGIGALALYFMGDFGTTPPPEPRTILTVHIDPPAGEVYIDDELVGKQGTMSLTDKFPVGKPFQVRVELDGFEPWAKTVTVSEGQEYRVDADLIIRDPMEFKVTGDMRRSEIDKAELKKLLEQRTNSFKNCFTRYLKPDSAYNAVLTLRGWVSQRGYVTAVDFRGANFESPEVKACLKRQLRGLKLPVLPGDYATFDHTFRARVGGRSVSAGEDGQ